jgi:hypothetical protein
MSEEQPLDVLIGVYLIPDLAQQDFDALVKLVEDNTATINGIILVSKDAEGEVHLSDAGDPKGRRPKVVGKVTRRLVGRKIGDQLDEQLPPGSAGVVAVYDHADAEKVNQALGNAIRKSTAQMDKAGTKELKAGLEEAGAGLAG